MELSTLTSSLLVGLIVSAATLGSNWYLFTVQFRTKRADDLNKEQLVELLLPLYTALEGEEFAFNAILHSKGECMPEEWIADAPKRLQKIAKIIRHRLYLADGELHKACLGFLEWLELNADTEERYQKLMRTVFEGAEHPDRGEIKSLRKIVKSEYDLRRKRHLK